MYSIRSELLVAEMNVFRRIFSPRYIYFYPFLHPEADLEKGENGPGLDKGLPQTCTKAAR